MNVFFKRLQKKVKLPTRAYLGDAGLDIYTPESFEIQPRADILIGTGLATEFDTGWVFRLCNKSSVATEKKVIVGADIIDSNYRGEIHIHLFNNSDKCVKFDCGDKVAQLVLINVWTGIPRETQTLTPTTRGKGGFGSSGKK